MNEQIQQEIREAVMDDGAVLKYRDWDPKAARGTVVCAHGIRSHSAWYGDSCGHLCRKGYRVLFPDRRGSGLNKVAGQGKVRHARWVADLGYFISLAGRELPGKPVHLMGISWGGRLAAVSAAEAGDRLKSVIFSTPGLVQVADYPLWRKLSVGFALLFGKEREFTLPLEDPALFTDDPDEQNYIDEDAFGLRRVTARFLFESRRLERLAKARFPGIRIPLILLLAGRDPIVDNEKAKKLFASCASADKILKVYEGARHTLEFDACHEEYFTDLWKWLDAHT